MARTLLLTKIREAAERVKARRRIYLQKDVAKEAGCSLSSVCAALNSGMLSLKSVNEQRREYLAHMLKKGAPLYEIALRGGLGLNTLYQYLYTEEVNILALQMPFRDSEEVSALIKRLVQEGNEEVSRLAEYVLKGLTSQQMGDETGETRESARRKICALGLHTIWREQEKRTSKKLRLREERTEIASLLEKRVKYLLADPALSWAERTAYEYNLKSQLGLSVRAIAHEKLVRFFSLYEEARKKGIEITLEYAAKEAGFARGAPEAGRILARMNLPAFHPYRLFPEKVQALKKTVKLGFLSLRDIAYLSGINTGTLGEHQIRTTAKGKKRLHTKGTGKSRTELTYRKASRIYQAIDLGFSREETAFVCDTTQDIVSYALNHKREIAPQIIKALQVIYPVIKVTKPYSTFDASANKYKVTAE
ncbi:hypothetical protein HYZ97_00355 [Candidatus Pacearchaeota archaeon]|nr:hypothetical protein [Candidatus Pacearchaeota archaeon]